jgi:peptide/nickel transport system ATP-binding protein
MYAGRIVERARANSLFRAPRHPYTLGLLSSFPPLHGAHRHMTGIPGSPPDLRALPSGCVFHPRCEYAMDRCRSQSPPLVPLAGQGGRLAACWLQEAGVGTPPKLGLADPAFGGSSAPAGMAPAGPAAGATPDSPPAQAAASSGPAAATSAATTATAAAVQATAAPAPTPATAPAAADTLGARDE